MSITDPRDRLIVALDLPSVGDAESIVSRLGDTVSFYKIGYELGFAGGLGFARELIADGKKVFIDFKLHDIGNTVAKGVESVAKLVIHYPSYFLIVALVGRIELYFIPYVAVNALYAARTFAGVALKFGRS